MKKLLYIYTLASTAVVPFIATPVLADNEPSKIQPTGTVDSSATSLNWANIKALAGSVITILLFIAGFVAVAYLVYNGIQYITSAGNADKVKAARAGIINAVIGIAVIAAAYFIVNFAIGLGKGVGDVVNSPNTIR